MHVLMIPSFYPTQETPLDGIFFKEQALMLKETGVKIGVLYPEIRPLKDLDLAGLVANWFQTSSREEDGLPTERLHGWNLSPGYLRGTMHLWCRAASHLYAKYERKYGAPDLVHAHSSVWAGIAARKIAEKWQIPFVFTEHRDLFLHGGPFSQGWLLTEIHKTAERASHVFAVSRALQKAMQQKFNIGRCEVLPNFVDPDYFYPICPKPPLQPFIFLTVAHLVKSKNIGCLLQAFQLLLQRDTQVKLHIVGDGPERQNLTRLAQQLNIALHVEFKGALSREALRQAYAMAHAFVLPSLYETFGVVCIEALLMGLPLISTRSGGPEDIVSPDMGLLVEKNDPHALMQALYKLKENYSSYDPQQLRKQAMERFGKAAITDRLIQVYASHGKKLTG